MEKKQYKINRFGISLLKEKYYTQSDVLKRGWTSEEITTLLPVPIFFENATNSKFPPIRCWKKKIVEQKEILRRKNNE